MNVTADLLMASMGLSFMAVMMTVVALVYISRIVKWSRRVDVSIVRDVMEQSPTIVKDIIDTHERLFISGGFSSTNAMREARRLHGLEP